ncbi:MAG: ABC transporter ATP-binding protein [Thermoplasmata archaeon]
MSSSELLRIEDLSAAWDGNPVLHQVSLETRAGEFLVLMGPNGSGKTTFLRCLAGLEAPTSGRIWLDGERIDQLPTHRRGIGMLFQEPALFPQRSVYENIAYGLELQRLDGKEIEGRIERLLQMLHLGALADRAPQALSGGERQRVALARSLAPRPRLLLLDEPFASVDPQIRTELRSDFRRALGSFDMTTIHVTHDREEGLFLGDRVVLIDHGSIVQRGTPREVYDHPKGPEIARFLGYNVLRDRGQIIGVHPKDMILSKEAPGVEVEIVASGSGGTDQIVHLRTAGNERIEVRRSLSEPDLGTGTKVYATWSRELRWDE